MSDELPFEFRDGIGGNMEPSMVETQLAELQNDFEVATYVTRRAAILDRAAQWKAVRDYVDARKVTDLIGVAKDVGALVDQTRKARSDPYFETHRALAAAGADFWQPVALEMVRIQALLDIYADARDAAIQRQQDEQRQQEDELRAQAAARAQQPRQHIDYANPPPAPSPAPAPPPQAPGKAAPIKGDYGYALRSQQQDEVEIVDMALIPEWIMNTKDVRDAIVAVGRKFAKQFDEIPGLKITRASKRRVGR